MFRRPVRPVTAAAAALAAVGGLTATATAATSTSAHSPAHVARHVVVVDRRSAPVRPGLVRRTSPEVRLARLASGGVEYTHARTTDPSDSFPGLVGQLTAGYQGTTGLYYDDGYSSALLPATTHCAGAKPGAEVDFTEDLDRNKDSVDAGQGLAGLPGSLLGWTRRRPRPHRPVEAAGRPQDLQARVPHSYLKVNTVFNVVRRPDCGPPGPTAPSRTRSSTAPPATVSKTFRPEINSQAIGYPAGTDWTKDNAATMSTVTR